MKNITKTTLTSTGKAAVIRQSDTVIMLIICTIAIFTIRMAITLMGIYWRSVRKTRMVVIPVTGGHDTKHKHGPDCGHEPVPHGNHIDYLVDGRLHHPHGDHCDDHGLVDVLKK
ncbi:TPA: hypothetical protein ACTDMQ_004466 [Salmonella enterica subsp. enterica serovar Muenchen]